MRRGASIFTAAACGLLCLYCAATGLRSFYRVDEPQYVMESGRGVMLIPKNGRVSVLVFKNPQSRPGFGWVRGSPYSIGGTDYGPRVLGFGGGTAPSGAKFVSVPFWFLALAFALPTARVVRREWRRGEDP
jgi:hypothetical protein